MKSTGLGYLCWIFGCHYAYVNKWGIQILFWLTAGGLLIWWIIDFFRIPSLVKIYNLELGQGIGGLNNNVNQNNIVVNFQAPPNYLNPPQQQGTLENK